MIELLNTALATEYVCTLRYYRHYFMAKGMLADAVKGEFWSMRSRNRRTHTGSPSASCSWAANRISTRTR